MSTCEDSTPEAAAPAADPPNAALFALSWIWSGCRWRYRLHEPILKAVQLFTGG
jgi:hypothetical protein